MVASAMGAQRHPGWRYNLEANPEIEVQAVGERYRARAEVLSDAEKESFAPGALRRAVAYAHSRQLDHLTAIPQIWRSDLLADSAWAFTMALAYGTVRPSKTWVATAEISGRVLSLSDLLKEGEVVPNKTILPSSSLAERRWVSTSSAEMYLKAPPSCPPVPKKGTLTNE